MLFVILGMISCDKQNEVQYDLEWRVVSIQKDLNIDLYTNDTDRVSEVLKIGNTRTILKQTISKIEIRCGNCEYTVNNSTFKKDMVFYRGGFNSPLE